MPFVDDVLGMYLLFMGPIQGGYVSRSPRSRWPLFVMVQDGLVPWLDFRGLCLHFGMFENFYWELGRHWR
jgi:hypothetical protein